MPNTTNPTEVELRTVIAAAQAGDEAAFATLVEKYKRELHVHCYRMLGSFDEAEDMVQETFLRAWRGRATFDGGILFRAWLYRIATNVCLDLLRRTARRVPSLSSMADIPWLQPYPDRLLDEAAPDDAQPDVVVVARETIELAYLAVIQLLPPRQRAALILRDVLDWSAAETAAALGTSVAAVNSALQRAKATLRERLPAHSDEWVPTVPTAEESALLAQFIDAHQRADAALALAISHRDIQIAMPPNPMRFSGLESVRHLMADGLTGPGEWRLVPIRANRQPAAASYLREWGGSEFKAFKVDVLRIADGKIREITTFGPSLFPEFGLPQILDPDRSEGPET